MNDEPLATSQKKGAKASERAPTPLGGRIMQALSIVGALAAVWYFGVARSDAKILGEVLAMAFATLLLFRFPDVQKFKAFGVEAEMKRAARKASRAAAEAAASVSQLRALASLSGRMHLDGLGISGHFGVGMKHQEKLRERDRVAAMLRLVGCSEDDIATASKVLERSIAFDLANAARSQLQSANASTGQLDEELKRLLFPGNGLWLDPAPASDFRKLFTRFGVTNDTAVQRILELEEYERSGKVPTDPGEE